MEITFKVTMVFDGTGFTQDTREHIQEALYTAIQRAKDEGAITPDDSQDAYLLGFDVTQESFA